MFSKAIVRRPARSMTAGITSNPQLGKPDYELALRQHDAYIKALESCGLSVTVLPAKEDFPDSCFMEDVAVCTRSFAMVTNPGAASRSGETKDVTEILSRFYKDIDHVIPPGTLEGGDIMMIGDVFYIGLSARTNKEGAKQLAAALEKRGFSAKTVSLQEVLHLKTGVSYIEHGRLLISGEFLADPEFGSFEKIEVPPEEAYAANCLWINERIFVPAGFPKTEKKIRGSGCELIVLDTSEFRKIDGGLSCLSLRF